MLRAQALCLFVQLFWTLGTSCTGACPLSPQLNHSPVVLVVGKDVSALQGDRHEGASLALPRRALSRVGS